MIEKNITTLIDSLADGFNNALPDPNTKERGAWQPVFDDNGNAVETFCNLFTSSVALAFRYDKIAGLNANEIFEFLGNPSNGWVSITGDVAQSHANDGCLVIAALKNPAGHGHVCVICPGILSSSKSFKKDVPKCVNVGRQVFFGKKVSFAFQTEPAYFVLGEMV